jgi:hypothetical protein
MCALPRQHLQADSASGQVVNKIDQVAEVATEPVELPGDQRVTLSQRF